MNIPLRFQSRELKNFGAWLFQVLLLAIIYHLAARLGLSMAYLQSNTSPVWPPTGIALAALLLLGTSRWPGVTLGVLLGSLLTGASLNLAMGMAVGNTLEALTAAYILQRFLKFHPTLDRIQDVTGLVVVAVFSTMISATLGVSTLLLTDLAPRGAAGSIWVTWWIGDLLGALVATPFLLTWISNRKLLASKRTLIEGSLAFILLGAVAWYVFRYEARAGIYHQALLYLIFPFVIWTAISLGQRGGTSAVLLVSGIAIWATVEGLGPFSLPSKNDNLVLLQTFLGVLALTSLVLAAATTERSRATQALQRRADDLAVLNESSRTFLDNTDPNSIFQTICDLVVTRIGLDAAWIEQYRKADGHQQRVAINGIPQADLRQLVAGHSIVPQDDMNEIHVFDLSAGSSDQISGFHNLAVVPMIFSGRVIGRMSLLSRQENFFSPNRRLLLQSYANLAAVVIQNSWLFEEARDSNRQLHALSQRLIKAQEEERLNLSRELHDESGQLLTGLLFELGQLDRHSLNGEQIQSKVVTLKNMAADLQENLHRLAINLRPASLDHLGLVTALEQYVSDFKRQYDIQIEFETVGMQDRRLPSEVETAIFRVVQESLTNVVLHAGASLVDVIISQRNSDIVATIEDNGVGFVPTPPTVEDHLGLFGMRERVEMLKGRFTLESSPGKGTTVNVEIPCDA
jgi:signal transduction histidine kinase